MLYVAGFWTSEIQNRNQATDKMSGGKKKKSHLH